MARPHEDRQRHTLVDHRPGGPRATFSAGTWCAVDVAHVRAARADAAVSAYETLIDRFARTGGAPHAAAILRSKDHRRVVTFLELPGHAAFRELAAAWDDHHLYAEHRASAESVSLGLYRVAYVAGDARVDPGSPDRYAFETIRRAPSSLGALLEPMASVPGFRGALILGADRGDASIVLYRFEHEGELDSFRGSATALAHLGPLGGNGETFFALHPVKTSEAIA